MEEKEYFIWEPYEGEEHKEKITITDFKMNPIKKCLDIKVLRTVNVSGLIKITMSNDCEKPNNSEKYDMEFKGKMKMVLNECEREKAETEKIVREYYNEVSKNSMRKKREEQYKKDVAFYFPREELGKKINGGEIDGEALKKIICDILEEKKELTHKQKFRVYHSPYWAVAIEEFMSEKGYSKKEDNKYAPKQK